MNLSSKSRDLEIFAFCLSALIGIVDNILMINAFMRLKKLLELESAAISRKQILLHLGTFVTATIALFFFYIGFLKGLFGLGKGTGSI